VVQQCDIQVSLKARIEFALSLCESEEWLVARVIRESRCQFGPGGEIDS